MQAYKSDEKNMFLWSFPPGFPTMVNELAGMRPIYHVYIVTNFTRTVLYTGVTNNLRARLYEHYMAGDEHFTGKYKAHFLIYYEPHTYVNNAIQREKDIKSWGRKRKLALIAAFNPQAAFLNHQFFDSWPPPEGSSFR